MRIRGFIDGIRIKAFLSKRLINHPTLRMGSDYGGFDIYDLNERVSGENSAVVYSFGIGEDTSFSDAVLKRYDANVYAYDPTPRSIEYCNNSEIKSCDRFHFSPVGLSTENETVLFYLPQNDEYVSGSCIITKDKKTIGIEVEMKDLPTLMKQNGHDHIDLLKMDIEGSEFGVVESWTSNKETSELISQSVNQICMEVHERFFDHGYKMLVQLVDDLIDLGFELISVSRTCEELTFLNKHL